MQYFLMLLGLLFIGLKLAGVIAWSWFFVTMPLWIGAALWVIIVLLMAIVALLW